MQTCADVLVECWTGSSGPLRRAHATVIRATWVCEVKGRGKTSVRRVGLGRSRYVWFVTGAESKVEGFPYTNCLN